MNTWIKTHTTRRFIHYIKLSRLCSKSKIKHLNYGRLYPPPKKKYIYVSFKRKYKIYYIVNTTEKQFCVKIIIITIKSPFPRTCRHTIPAPKRRRMLPAARARTTPTSGKSLNRESACPWCLTLYVCTQPLITSTPLFLPSTALHY